MGINVSMCCEHGKGVSKTSELPFFLLHSYSCFPSSVKWLWFMGLVVFVSAFSTSVTQTLTRLNTNKVKCTAELGHFYFVKENCNMCDNENRLLWVFPKKKKRKNWKKARETKDSVSPWIVTWVAEAVEKALLWLGVFFFAPDW